MSDALNPKAQAFLRSVQDSDEPTRDDFDRVRVGVKAHLAASVAAGVAALVTAKAAAASEAAAITAVTATATTAVTAATTATVGSGAAVPTSGVGVAFATKLVAAVLVVGAAAGGTTAVVRHQQAMHPSAVEATTVHVASNAPVPLQPAQARPPMPLPPSLAAYPRPPCDAHASRRRPPRPRSRPRPRPFPRLRPRPRPRPRSPPPPPPPRPRPPSPSPPRPPLALLPPPSTPRSPSSRDARSALRSGGAARTLALLDEHARRFPRGALAEDCDAERIFALCALGRDGEARSLASRFLTGHPASPHAPSVRASCGGGAP